MKAPPDPGLSQDQLRAWLLASGRSYVILRAQDLVDALDWPAGVAKFRHVLGAYEAYRGRGQVEVPCQGQNGAPCAGDETCACGGARVVARKKGDRLELEELEEARAQIDRDIARMRT